MSAEQVQTTADDRVDRHQRRRLLVANAPVSYGAFEITVGIDPHVPEALTLLDWVSDAGYTGIDLGPVGYLGDRRQLPGRLAQRGLGLAGGYLELPFSEPARFQSALTELDALLDIFDGLTPAASLPSPRSPTPARPSARATRAGGRRPVRRPRRGRVGALRRVAGPGRRPLPAARLRAHVPSPHRHLHRGALGDRATAGDQRRRALPGHRPSAARRR